MGSGASAKKLLCWKHSGHGQVDFKAALTNSCNVFFCHIGLKTGPDAIEMMAHRFALGSATGLEFQGEKAGLIPGRTMFKSGRRHWFDGDTLNMSIGQGTILFTPMQAAQMISVVANRGKVYRPRMVREIRLPSKELFVASAPELLSEFTLSAPTWDFLDDALISVVENGTGQECKIAGVRIAGKTGTAQNPHGKDHAWFVAFAPVEKPRVAVAVLIEHGIHGATAAAPIARRVILAALADQLSADQVKSVAPHPEASGD
jgi:penicillin-binding protein 2